jgi:hypothetical protein
MDLGQIAEGFYNQVRDKEKDLYRNRIEICHSCKLLVKDNIFGEMCNNKLYLNPLTDETSTKKKPGFLNGCDCVLKAKCRVPLAECPLGKW